MKADNPFSLTFGKEPRTLINRLEYVDEVVNTFTDNNPASNTYIVCGVRGSGKTVLMTSVVKEIKKRDEWISVDLNSSLDLLEDFADRLSDETKSKGKLAEVSIDLSIAGIGVGLTKSNGNENSISKLDAMLAAIKKKNRKVLITVDEVRISANMRAFISQFQIFLRKDYPIFLLMTGLYENIYAVQNDAALTFLLRSPKIVIEPLSILQITQCYMERFNIDKKMAIRLASLTKGYAFAFQALGRLYWDYKDELSLDDILIKLDSLLDDFAYRKIWSSLSGKNKEVVRILVKNGRMPIKKLREELRMNPSVFSNYRSNLMKEGIVSSPEYGYLELALPRFSQIAEIYIAYENESL